MKKNRVFASQWFQAAPGDIKIFQRPTCCKILVDKKLLPLANFKLNDKYRIGDFRDGKYHFLLIEKVTRKDYVGYHCKKVGDFSANIAYFIWASSETPGWWPQTFFAKKVKNFMLSCTGTILIDITMEEFNPCTK